MSQSKDTRFTPELAREVCQRTASAATIEGSISSLGSEYVLGLKAVNCGNGDMLTQEQITAGGKEQVLKALGEAATKIRKKLGESLASVQKYDAPLENVTTSSLDALRAFSLGSQAHYVKNDCAVAIPLYQRAISLDPNFAMAYGRLGTCYANLSQTVRATENIAKAYDLRQRVSEVEKFYIVARYEDTVTGNLEAAIRSDELWAQTYPRDSRSPTGLGVLYRFLGVYDKALAAYQAALRLDPGSGLSYANLARDYLNLNRLEDAKAVAQEAQSRHLDSPLIHNSLYLIGFLQHDVPAMDREATASLGRPGYEDILLYYQSDTAACGGEFSKARKLTWQAVSSAKRADKGEQAAAYQAEAAVREALTGNMVLAKHQANVALALSNGRQVQAMAALALGLAGDAANAILLAKDLAKRFPESTMEQSIYLPSVYAAVALERGDGAKNTDRAIEALTVASPYELGSPMQRINFALYPVYVRGEAYLASRQGPAAVAEFQKILDHPGVVLNEPIGALAHLQLGRAYALSGDTAKAKTAYQEFLILWKDADPDIPILKEAKAEYAKLR